ncbi:MAG: DUF4363 family protein [Clostridia bacterium]|nr:DUF4363 family protein [Clostridia bacterium]
MKNSISIIIIFLLINALCIWDIIFVNNTLEYMHTQTHDIFDFVVYNDISDSENYETIRSQVVALEKYWESKENALCLVISRKDMQPITDHLQYLRSAIILHSQEDAITHSRLLHANVKTVDKITEFRLDNIF